MRIYDILIMQYFVCFAGLFYGLQLLNLNVILIFGISMVLNATLMIRARKAKKEDKL